MNVELFELFDFEEFNLIAEDIYTNNGRQAPKMNLIVFGTEYFVVVDDSRSIYSVMKYETPEIREAKEKSNKKRGYQYPVSKVAQSFCVPEDGKYVCYETSDVFHAYYCSKTIVDDELFVFTYIIPLIDDFIEDISSNLD